ncbi:MAG: hypothetical protein K0R64_2485 [Novosphingobium lindaniclasticum]|jgi:hypothetical protein|uniref:hypothetical protein n=1 Tax=Novosphingobium lindaniclasticum TaxID=1329895 RepID=UPI0024094E26|nr:hypothetical protein [Novosphingobium lindaniclasticum]MDF2639501.1 hypothetical protein [Novosphingobium lindaniclasticum]
MRPTFTLLAGAALLASPSVQAQKASGLDDLVGTRAAGGETSLQSRGWVHIKTDKGDDRLWSYWWQPARKSCVIIAVVDGRFDSIAPTTPPDCNQQAGSKGPSGSAVAAGVGIAAIIGAIALAHKAHNHEGGQHYADEASEAAYDRGFRDGLYSQTYHNYDRSEPYSRGYEAGVSQKGHETAHRDGHRADGAGYRPSVDLGDLVDARAAGADGEMQRRGFRNVGGLKSGLSSYTYWFNDRTRQCVQMGVADGRVQNVTDVGSYQGCR